MIVFYDRMNMIIRPVAWIKLSRLPKKENILISMYGIVPSVPNYAVQPESHSVLLFMVCAIHSDVCSIWCTCANMMCICQDHCHKCTIVFCNWTTHTSGLEILNYLHWNITMYYYDGFCNFLLYYLYLTSWQIISLSVSDGEHASISSVLSSGFSLATFTRLDQVLKIRTHNLMW